MTTTPSFDRSPERVFRRRRLAALALVVSSAWLSACQTTQERPPQKPPSSEANDDESGKRTSNRPTQATERPRGPVVLPEAPAKVTAAPSAIGKDVEPAADIVAMLAPKSEVVSARANRVVGKISAPMKRGKPESTLGNFVTDAMRTETESVAGIPVDMCFTNSGGLRVDLAQGKITEGMVVELMPFDNAIVVVKMNGERLTKLARKVAQRGDPVSGLSYRKRGRTPSDLKIGGRAISPTKRYTICTNDYVYEGGSNYGLSDVKDAHYTGILIREAILHAFEAAHKKGETIDPKLDGRVIERTSEG